MTRSIALKLNLAAFLFASTLLAGDWQNAAPGVDYQKCRKDDREIHATPINPTNDAIQSTDTRHSAKNMKASDCAKETKAIAASSADYIDAKCKTVRLVVGASGKWGGRKDTS